MRSDWVSDDILGHILAALMPQNALAIRVSRETGLRIGDVLRLKPQNVEPNRAKFTIKEQKTGKTRSVYIPKKLREELFSISGKYWVFEHRLDSAKHRTRQAVFKDIRRAAKAFRVLEHVSPHSARKLYAVAYYQRCKSLQKVKNLLNHSDEAVTMIYAMADVITRKKSRG